MATTQLLLPLAEQAESEDRDLADLRNELVAELAQAPRSALSNPKDEVRSRHHRQRADTWRREFAAIRPRLSSLIHDFADGADVDPQTIEPQLVPVLSATRDADLFRLATLLWSVPVSRGYGRRMRFLVRDRSNEKLIGVFALGDPVFNLGARDQWLGWTVNDRRDRLVNVMDAFVVGAVPPYASLLCGKLVFSLIASAEVGELFARRYGDTTGIISGRKKAPKLALVTVTSALGRSSLYNRLRLASPSDPSRHLVNLVPVGWTRGYGHFQVNDDLFARLRSMLLAAGHPYATGHRYGDGPNWRMRVTRVALQQLGLSSDLQRHGIERQVFALPLASNFREFLTGRDLEADLSRPSLSAIAAAARARWVVPRSSRDQRFSEFRVASLEQLFRSEGAGVEVAGAAPMARLLAGFDAK